MELEPRLCWGSVFMYYRIVQDQMTMTFSLIQIPFDKNDKILEPFFHMFVIIHSSNDPGKNWVLGTLQIASSSWKLPQYWLHLIFSSDVLSKAGFNNMLSACCEEKGLKAMVPAVKMPNSNMR